MLKKIFTCTILLFTFLSGTAMSQSLENTFFITEHLPPYNYKENNMLKGISVRVLLEALNAVGIKYSPEKIKLYPWARGYKTALRTPNTCLFSTVRNEFRENKFKWAGPITNATLTFYSDNHGIEINSMEDLKRYSITTARQGIGHQILKQEGFPENKLDTSNEASSMLEKLERKRVDIVLENENVVYHTLKGKKRVWKSLKELYVLDLGEIYFAFNNDTEDHVVAKLQKGIDIIRKNGKLEKIVQTIPKNKN
ncbi:substrate-binding periplasmic protein [Maridesulfovibrio sp.]|uniref:substrate-binding periplasmic protein n=1 Tax=Maridesulfovibrio sp. TaxID=2795000 RepID=UPI003BA8FAC9